MAMKVATFNGCKVYNLSSGKTMPQWLSEAQKRKMAKDEDYRRRLELIQDFEMTVASQNVKMTRDGEHIIVTGTYPPVVRCYTVSDLALKFQRGLTCEVVAFETLSDDFGKLVFLQADRTLNFHAPYGTHYSIRVPKFGRDLAYSWNNCDLLVASSGEELYRLNLETGQFKEPFSLGFTGCNKVNINPVHGLVGCGGDAGICEFWDPRAKKMISKINLNSVVEHEDTVGVSALKFDTDGLTLGVGTSNGYCTLFDIRSSKPLFSKEHQYGLPVIDVTFHNSSRHVISTDRKIVKIWEREEPNMGKILTNIETPADMNSIHVVEDKRGQSGLMFMAGEQSRVMTYFVPQLGPAPRWCSFLEGLTEELEETVGQSVYEDYKFVTKTEIDELGATSLIGTAMLRAYMHGFFIEMSLYNKLRAVSKPFEYEEYRLKRIKEKIDEKRQSRITPRKRLPKVNKALAEKLLSKGKKQAGEGDEPMIDDRFAALFKREDFQVDEESDAFKLANPVRSNHQKGQSTGGGDDSDDDLRDMYTAVDGGNDNDDNDDDDDDDDDYGAYYNDADGDKDDMHLDIDEDEEEERLNRYRKSQRKKRGRNADGGDDAEEEGPFARAARRARELAASRAAKSERPSSSSDKMRNNRGKPVGLGLDDARRPRKTKAPRMFELTEGVNSAKAVFAHTADAKSRRQSDRAISSVPLSDRLTSGGDKSQSNSQMRTMRSEKEGLVREISFMPKNDDKDRHRKGTAPASLFSDARSDKERANFFGPVGGNFDNGQDSRASKGGKGKSKGRGKR